MKTYHLRITQDEFTNKTSASSGSTTTYTWRTPIYDLYDNDQYTNFSVKRSNYGTDLLGTGVYTGIEEVSEVGQVVGDRFLDTTSRIDIVDWKVEHDASITTSIVSSISVYTTDSESNVPFYLHATPSMVSNWAKQENITENVSILNIDSMRYAFFELVFTIDSEISTVDKTINLFVSIDIDSPTVNGYFPATRKIQDKFPEWMSLREYDPIDPFSATPSTPSSVGGQLINAMAGEWLSDIQEKLRYQNLQQYISTVNTNAKSWVFISKGIPDLIWSITGDGTQLARTSDIGEFYESLETDDAFFWNRLTDEIFTNKVYDELSVNGEAFSQTPYQLWNSIDDIGASVDLFRLQSATPFNSSSVIEDVLESNDHFKKRILDVYKNKPGVNADAFKKTLRRELSLWRFWGATPNSEYFGATPEVREISDLKNEEKYFTEAGMPTRAFKDLVEYLAIKYPTTWGYFKFDKAFWDTDGLFHKGYETIPRQFDATPVSSEYLESGVGDGNDLYIFKPKANSGAVDFTADLKVRGRRKVNRSEYVPLTFTVQVYGTATEDLWANPVVDGYFTIELTVLDNSATPATPSQSKYYSNIIVSAQNNIDYYQATPTDSARALVEWATPDGYTDIAYPFKNTFNGELYPGQIDLTTVTKVVIKPGHFNGNMSTPSYDNQTTTTYYKAWFDGQSSNFMGSGGGTDLTKTNFNVLDHNGSFWFESQRVVHPSATPNSWSSDKYLYTITLNGAQPNVTVNNFTLDLPNIVYPASTSSRSIFIELVTSNGNGTYGAFSDYNASTPIFIPSTYLAVDGDATWTNGYRKSVSTSTTSITFSTTTGSAYPVTSSIWERFESSLVTPISGTVDENGPWRNNNPSDFGNTNYVLDVLSLDRSDFGVAQTSDYIITWVGISSVSNNDVVVWLETNTIQPAVTDPGENNIEFTYPDNAIVETLNGSIYEFSTFNIYARIKPGVNSRWNPKAHSGWFYDDADEYYLYADPYTEYATTNTKVLGGVNRLGAPLIVKGLNVGGTPLFDLRQVAFLDGSTPTMTNTEIVSGTGTSKLFASYKDIYNIKVTNISTGAHATPLSTMVLDNIVYLNQDTNKEYEYQIEYKVARSFYTDNEHIDTDRMNKTKVVFDATPSLYSAYKYSIDYETSIFDPATPLDIPLNTMYTSLDEGFIFIDHDVHSLSQVEVSISPSKIVADGQDFAMVVFRSFDEFGNPKPYQSFNIYTNFGRFDKSSVTTDKDGFAYAMLQSNIWSPSTPAYPSTPALSSATPGTANQGLILVDGAVDTRLGFEIQIPVAAPYRLSAVMDSDHIVSDGVNATFVLGRVETPQHAPVPYAVVFWKKARSLYDLFNNNTWSQTSATPGQYGLKGRVVADANGRFSIGPFISSTTSGYWMVSAESGSASPNFNADSFTTTGDVVYWYEYPNITNTIDPITQLPTIATQSATPYWTIPTYTSGYAFPTTYDEAHNQAGYNAGVLTWEPPAWYAIDKYQQYQMGLFGSTYNIVGATPIHPEYKEF